MKEERWLNNWQFAIVIAAVLIFALSLLYRFGPELNGRSSELNVDWSYADSMRTVSKKKFKRRGRVRDFRGANIGDYWKIDSENIALMKKCKASANDAQFRRNVVVLLTPGTKVEIVETKRWYCKYVYAYNGRDEVFARGWILGDSVDRARLMEKGRFTD